MPRQYYLMPGARLFITIAILISLPATAQMLAPLEAYGALPTTELVTISPSGKRRIIYESETSLQPVGPVGLTPDRKALVFVARNPSDDVRTFYRMSLDDGEMTGPILKRGDIGVARVLTDIDWVVYGVEYEGFKPSYAFFDAGLDKRMATIQAGFPDTSVTLVSWSEDFRDLVVLISGGWHAGAYLLFADDVEQPEIIAESRPNLTSDQVAPTSIMSYKARDGLDIPALLTARPEIVARGGAPLIVMPHGGPESNDVFSFDWLAQFFASRGYVVLQPQFRGSSGFGLRFMLAGRGEWGRKMQWDLDDGVDNLIKDGLVDAAKVCIVGASYGGYAALAAGAFSPNMYRCIVAIAPVTDLRRMLQNDLRRAGKNHWVVRYWETQYGADRYDWDALEAISPARQAGEFTAPVLLVHGKRDTVVPIDQSRRMRRALKNANKEVTLVELDGEDHWLSQDDTRIESLRVIARFIEKNLASSAKQE